MNSNFYDKPSIRILTVEDDRDFSFLIQNTLNRESDMDVVGCAGSEASAMELAAELRPDLVLMDLNLSSSLSDGIHTARNIRLHSDALDLILTAYESPDIVVSACKQTFASGYLFKSQFDLLVETVRKTVAGPTPQLHLIYSLILSDLSSAEQSVLHMLMGKNVTLHSSAKTISNQKSSILRKLGLHRQEDLIHLMKQYL